MISSLLFHGWRARHPPFASHCALNKPIVDKLHATLLQAINDPSTNEGLKKVGAEPQVSTPAEFAALIAKDWKSFGEAIRVANLKVD